MTENEDLDARIDSIVQGALHQHLGPLMEQLAPLVAQARSRQETGGGK